MTPKGRSWPRRSIHKIGEVGKSLHGAGENAGGAGLEFLDNVGRRFGPAAEPELITGWRILCEENDAVGEGRQKRGIAISDGRLHIEKPLRARGRAVGGPKLKPVGAGIGNEIQVRHPGFHGIGSRGRRSRNDIRKQLSALH